MTEGEQDVWEQFVKENETAEALSKALLGRGSEELDDEEQEAPIYFVSSTNLNGEEVLVQVDADALNLDSFTWTKNSSELR